MAGNQIIYIGVASFALIGIIITTSEIMFILAAMVYFTRFAAEIMIGLGNRTGNISNDDQVLVCIFGAGFILAFGRLFARIKHWQEV